MNNDFIKERNQALLSLDKKKILLYLKKYDIPLDDSNEILFWLSIHRAILGIRGITKCQEKRSRAWLIANGFL